MSDELFETLCYGALQGEKLRVLRKHAEGVPLTEKEHELFESNISTQGEHLEAMRRTLWKLVRLTMPDRVEELREAIEEQLNEGGAKP